MLPANAGFQAVIGAISLIGSLPTASELTTTAGRVLQISAPSVGSNRTRQISPRLGASVLNDVPLEPLAPFLVGQVMRTDTLGLI
jgi:hypothetical protein